MIRTSGWIVALLLPCAAAMAERPPIQEMQLAPLNGVGQGPAQTQQPAIQPPAIQLAPARPPGQFLPPAPAPDQPPAAIETEPMGNPPGGQPDQPTATAVQPPWPNLWVPAGGARIQALDKVNAQATTLTMKVGQPTSFGSLTITVKACVIRPPDQPSDAAAYLDVTDSHPDSPGFDGWMLQNEPSVSMMQNPVYDVRVAGCA